MPPRKEIWDELARIWGQAKPAVVDPPQTKEHNRTRKIILKTATITSTITAVIISIVVITAFTVINSSSKPILLILLLASSAMLTSSCAGIVPSQAIVTEKLTLNNVDDIPQTFDVHSMVVAGYPQLNDDLKDYMREELRNQGFTIAEDKPEAVFIGRVNWSSHTILGTNVTLRMVLKLPDKGRRIWECEIYRDYDVYSSLIDGAKKSINKSIDSLSRNISLIRDTPQKK